MNETAALVAELRSDDPGRRETARARLTILGPRAVAVLIEAPLDVTRIAERVGVSQYNVSKHLRILREAGLVEVEKNGRRRLYGLSESIRRQADGSAILARSAERYIRAISSEGWAGEG